MTGELITVFGGSGFVGKHVVRALAKAGYRVRVAMRRPHLGHELRVMGNVGQVQLVQANVRNLDSVARALDGAHGVVNLVGLLFERGKQKFADVMADGASHIASIANANGITKFVQISAIGADKNSASSYARAKAAAEAVVLENVPTATILRPSIIFGPEDDFFNRFASMATLSPALPLISGGKTLFQPVSAVDVADAVLASLVRADAKGQTYELGGAATYSFKTLLEIMLKEIDRTRFFAPLPFGLAKLLGGLTNAIFQFVPFADPPLTGDQVELLKTDNVVSKGAKSFADLGITRTQTIEAILPSYLYRFRPYGQYQAERLA